MNENTNKQATIQTQTRKINKKERKKKEEKNKH
jgi:hypothetical protein